MRPDRAAAGERHRHRGPRGRFPAWPLGSTGLSTLDRFLPVWILVAMTVGLGLGRAIPGLAAALDTVQVGSVSLPIAIGLLLMMYPVLAKVRYRQLDRVTGDRRLLVSSLGSPDRGPGPRARRATSAARAYGHRHTLS